MYNRYFCVLIAQKYLLYSTALAWIEGVSCNNKIGLLKLFLHAAQWSCRETTFSVRAWQAIDTTTFICILYNGTRVLQLLLAAEGMQ